MIKDIEEIQSVILDLSDDIGKIEQIRCMLAIISDGLVKSPDPNDSDMAGTMVFIETSLRNEIDNLERKSAECVAMLCELHDDFTVGKDRAR